MLTFTEFEKQINFEKLSYDLAALAPQELKESSNLFSQEQFAFITKTIAVMNISLLRQYHEWLVEGMPR